MVKYKITFDREGCIGCFSCAGIADKFWSASNDGKSDLKGAKLNEKTGKFELIIDEKDFEVNKNASEACPAGVIKVEKVEE